METKTTPTEKTRHATESELRDRKQAAAFLHLSPTTLANWHSTQRMKIPCFKLGKRVFYRESDLTKWLELQAVNPII
jgi:hypothetical protein